MLFIAMVVLIFPYLLKLLFYEHCCKAGLKSKFKWNYDFLTNGLFQNATFIKKVLIFSFHIYKFPIKSLLSQSDV